MKTDNWQDFMFKWDDFHRNKLLPHIHKSDHKTRRQINQLLSDLKSSLKWCRYNECRNIYLQLYEIVFNQTQQQ